MKRGFLIAILFCLFSGISYSQWEEQRILPNGNFFNDVFVLDIYKVWVVGQNGIIMKSNNLGFTWLRLSAQTTEHINSVWFVDEQKGWICGNNGLLRYTLNGGYFWQESGVETENDLKDVFFIDNNKGWVVGDNGLIYITNDGGITWESQNSGTIHDLFSVHFINENEGWAAGYSGDILHTTNGGSSWTMQPQAVQDELFCIFFTDENHGWASGADGLLKTTDGGDTWETNIYQYGLGYRSVYFENAFSGYLISNTGLTGFLSYTSDGGETWEVKNESGYTLQSMHFCDEGYGFAVGYIDVIVYCPIFGGGCGNLTINPELSGFSDVFFLDSLNGWATGSGIIHTDDGGNNWYTQAYETHVDNIYFTNENIGYACSQYNYEILKTVNGGKTWLDVSSAPNLSYSSLQFSDSLNGRFASTNGKVLKTTDGCQTWTFDEYEGGFTSLYFVDENHGWIAGMQPNGAPYGLIKRTVDGGVTWTDSQTYAWLMSVFFINQNIGWTAGHEGFFYITNDGGANWNLTDIGYEETLQNIEFMNENKGWMCVGYDNNFVLHSIDGGYTWEEQYIPNEKYVYAFDFIDENKGWAVGNGIFHTSNGGTVGEKENSEIQTSELLVSPNPCYNQFNIKLPENKDKTNSIEILNLNGQIVKSIEKTHHDLSINIEELPAGLYIVKIKTNSKIYSQKILKK